MRAVSLTMLLCLGPMAVGSARTVEQTICTPTSRITDHITLLEKMNTTPRALVVLLPGTGPMDRTRGVFSFLPESLVDDRTAVLLIPRQHSDAPTNQLSLDLEEIAKDDEGLIREAEKHLSVRNPRLSLVGLSEGALIAAEIIARGVWHIQSLVVIGSPGLPGPQYALQHLKRQTESMGLDPKTSEDVEQYYQACYSALLSHSDTADKFNKLGKIRQETHLTWSPEEFDQQENMLASKWMISFLNFDPEQAYCLVKCPLLIIYGELDEEMDAKQNAACIKMAVSNNPAVTADILPGLSHNLTSTGPGPAETDANSLIQIWVNRNSVGNADNN